MLKTLALALALTALAASAADAHARLLRAQPRVGSTLAAAPTELRLLFSESLQPAASHVSLKAADGRAVPLGPLSLDPANPKLAVVPIRAPLEPG